MRLIAVIAASFALTAPVAHGAGLPLTIPAPGKGSPYVLAAGDSGALIAVWATNEIYEGYGPVTVDIVAGGPGLERRRWTTTNSVLSDSARDSKANLDLLVARATGSGDERLASIGAQKFTLYRARQDGRVTRLWSGGLGRKAMVARRGSKIAIAWVDYRATSPVLRLVTSSNGRAFSRPRPVRGVLPRFLRTANPSFINDLDLTLDADGDPIIALTAWRRPKAALVIAELSRTGRVRHRQVSSNADGLVHAKTTARGRVAVMVDDTGIEGERGECVGDHLGRRLFATVREPRATRFARVSRLDAHPLECSGRDAALVTNSGETVAVAWTSSPQGQPGAVKTVFSTPEQGFGAPLTIAEHLSLRAAVFGQAVFNIFGIQQTTDDPYAGPLVEQTVSAAGVSPPSAVEPTGATSVLADTNPDDTHVLVGWRRFRDTSLHIAGYGGP